MVLSNHIESGELVRDTVSGIQVERWQRTGTTSQPRVTPPPSLWPSDCFLSQVMSTNSSNKVGTQAAAAQKPAAKKAFGEVLKQSSDKKPAGYAGPKPPPLPVGKPNAKTAATITGIKATLVSIASPAPSAATTESFSQARAGMHAEAGRLGQVRTEAHTNHEHRVDARLLDLIVKELSVELSGDAPRSMAATATLAADGGPAKKVEPGTAMINNLEGPSSKVDASSTVPGLKARAAAALVERIEAFVKSNRPALAVTLSGAINARVEVERTGPGEVSLRVQGTKGPPPAEDLSRIREAIRERGLKLTSLSIG